jgi:hypothetical protein
MKTTITINELHESIKTAKLIIDNSNGMSPVQVRKWLRTLKGYTSGLFDRLITNTK